MNFLFALIVSSLTFAAIAQKTLLNPAELEKSYLNPASDAVTIKRLKIQTLTLGKHAVPVLIKVMKEGRFPENKRWHATFMLGRIMGKKSAPFVAKFTDHPHWMMRLAALKTLLGLKQDQYVAVYAKALKDPSLIVRVQALDNISKMKIEKLSSNVWNMLYDQTNYSGENGKLKRTPIVKNIIRTLGDLKFKSAGKPLARLIQKPGYKDLADDLDYSLEKISGLKSPDTNWDTRRKFWTSTTVAKNI